MENSSNMEEKVTVLRTSDAAKCEIRIPLSSTLNALKEEISKVMAIHRKHQRLFHLGRELKSGRRSLSALGFGKHDNFLVHLHSTQPKTFELSSDEDDSDVVVEDVVPPARVAGVKRAGNEEQVQQQQQGAAESVIELLDDESDDDIAVVNVMPEAVAAKRRRDHY